MIQKLKSKRSGLILSIIIVGALVRFVGLSKLPAALNRDEAAIGYNAYSLLQTGKDEHGQSFPLAFKSIGDYKMPGYIYATILPVKLWGLNEWSIRFWSAIGGVLAVGALYGLGKQLFNQRLGLLAAALMALNPWAIFYSRIGFEANLALGLWLAGLYLLLRLKRQWWGLGLWLLAMLTYSASLIFIPLMALLNLRPLKKLLVFLGLGAVIFVSIFKVSAQKQGITIFADPQIINHYNQQRTAVFAQNPLLARTWWNKYVFYGRLAAANYLKTFSPRFLLTQGGNHPWHRIPGQGYFYLMEIAFGLYGLWLLLRYRSGTVTGLLLFWLLLAPLPSAITIDAPHATRSLQLLPVVLLLAAYGLDHWLKKRPGKKTLLVVSLAYVVSVGYAGYRYLHNYPRTVLNTLPVGLKESLQFVFIQNTTEPIYLTDIHESTYLYPLVYQPFPPDSFQSESVWTKPDTAGLTHAYRFGRFQVVDDLKDVKEKGTLIVTKPLNSGAQADFVAGNYFTYIKP